MAELADAHGSGPCESNFMGVQVPSSAPKTNDNFHQKIVVSFCLDLLVVFKYNVIKIFYIICEKGKRV